MATFILVFIVFLLAVAGMSIGVLMGRKKIQGSCGGVGAIDGLESSCKCENPCEKKQSAHANGAQADNKPTEHRVDFPA